ncbi:DUF4138 domain-containing protein [Arenibacter sp. F20364]|uniref:DUF4138 domain-containing protein n=1 Tax=Arenibacter sp. F20364 TaxID=2926415 RepID=UPI001FF5A5C0|nr:DUF4138 domain-containing protein [Arenibacter sp. F20364]MCK0192901.1 conjugative transposon protein TraN [Arenibacter sp. F20364]
MKILTPLFIWFVSFVGFSQNDTIQVSKNDKVVVVFPDNISDAFIGDELKFFMDFKRDEGSSFAQRILKLYYNERATDKRDYTSLTAITDNGNSYEFTLELSAKPKKPTWYISPDQAVTNILGKNIDKGYQQAGTNGNYDEADGQVATEPVATKTVVVEETEPEPEQGEETAQPTAELYKSDPKEYYRLRCYYMQFDKARIPRFFARNDDIFLWLKGVYYNQNELYLQFRLENKEGVDLDINFVKFSTATAYKGSSSNQKTELTDDEVLLKYKIPKRVEGNTENHFVVVLKKMTLDRNKVLVVDLDESNGNRDLSLEIDHGLLNNPKRF